MLFSDKFLRFMFTNDQYLIEEVEVGREDDLVTYHRVFSYQGLSDEVHYYRLEYSLLGLSNTPIFKAGSLNQCECPEVKQVIRTTWEPI